ncbi:MAG: phosphotransferase [Cytophagales bacterium]|nr:phosphotransferase [Rhizobacter sp.]
MTHSPAMWRPALPSIAKLLARHGLSDCRARLVAELDCAVWRIATPAGADLSLRIYAPERQDITAINTEITWLSALADAGVHVPRPLPDLDGRYLMPWQAHAAAASQHAVLLSWLPGRMLYKSLRPVHLRRVGELVAQLHNSSQTLTHGSVKTHPGLAHTADVSAWAQGHRQLPSGYPKGLQASVQRAAQHLQQHLNDWPHDAAHWGFIHGDLHLWNIVFHHGVAGAIDFTDCGWGFMALDLAGVLQFLKHPLTPADAHIRQNYAPLRGALFEGYASQRPLPDSLRAQIEPLIAMRMMQTLQWIVDDWPAPDHRSWGPGFLARLSSTLDEAFE